jgi:histidinol-phosphate aminotransferase
VQHYGAVTDRFASLLRPELADLTAYVPHDPPGIRVRLDANEAPAHTRPVVAAAVARAIAATPLERYPDARMRELKARIAERSGARPDELLVGTGSDELIALVATALSRPRGKAPQPVVLTTTPTFVMYRVTARAHGWKPIEVPLDAAWDLDVAQMKRAIELAEPNVVYVATPNNPTGNRMSESRLRELALAAKGALFVIDEAYIDYCGGSLREWRAEMPNVGILRTLSKVGLAALRIGWLEADEALIREIDKVRQPYNVSATSQAAAAAVLADAWDDVRAQVASVVSERDRVAREIAAMTGFAVTPSAANFLWVKTPRPAGDVHGALVSRGILVRSFHSMGGRMAQQLRIGIGAPAENDALLEALRACG